MSFAPPENHDGLTIYALSKLGQSASRSAEQALAPIGLRPREFSTLSLIDELGGSAQSEIADRLGIDRSDMVAVVDKLEAQALVKRTRDATDRRRHVVASTKKGAALARRGGKALEAADAEFLRALSHAEQRQLRNLAAALGAPADRR